MPQPTRAAEVPAAYLLALGRAALARRRKLGLTAAEVARRARLAQSSVTEAETGRARLSLTALYALAGALETTPGKLLRAGEIISDKMAE